MGELFGDGLDRTGKNRYVVAGGQIEANRARISFLFIMLLEKTANFVCLHSDDWISLRVKIDAAIIDLYPDQVLVQFVAVSEEGLFRDKIEEAGLLRGVREVLARENSAKLLPFLEDRNV